MAQVNQLLTSKHIALEEFTQRLLSSNVKDQIAKMILFGSVARGDAEQHSDIDVLVFGFGNLDKISETCAEISFDIAVESGELVQALIYSVNDLLFPQSYFIYKVVRDGKDIYKMDEDEFKSREIESYLPLAQEYLDAAQSSLTGKKYRVAVDTAYNAAELCVRALLTLKPSEMPKSHGGLLAKFGELYIMSELIPKKLGRDLNRMMELRNKARYDAHFSISRKEAQDAIRLAEALIKFLKDSIYSNR